MIASTYINRESNPCYFTIFLRGTRLNGQDVVVLFIFLEITSGNASLILVFDSVNLWMILENLFLRVVFGKNSL